MIKLLVGRLTKLPTHSVPVLGFGIAIAISDDDASFQLQVRSIRTGDNFCDWDTCTYPFLDFQKYVRCNIFHMQRPS